LLDFHEFQISRVIKQKVIHFLLTLPQSSSVEAFRKNCTEN